MSANAQKKADMQDKIGEMIETDRQKEFQRAFENIHSKPIGKNSLS